MKTSCSEIKMHDIVTHVSTRAMGEVARRKLLEAVRLHGSVMVDLEGLLLTPSFADECFGLLCENLGLSEFRNSVKLANVHPASKTLILHVVNRRGQHHGRAA